MPGYADAIKEHATIAARIHAAKLAEIEQRAGFQISKDGTNTATNGEDVKRYLQAIRAIGGMIAYTSAKMVVTNAIHKLGLPAVPL